MEIWKDVVGYDGKYLVSNFGRVKRLAYCYTDTFGRYRELPDKILCLGISKTGYVMIDLYKNDVRKRVYVHRLVAEAFITNPTKLPCVNHRDENKQNNCVDNLEWCNYSYNNNYGTATQRMVVTRMHANWKSSTYTDSEMFLIKDFTIPSKIVADLTGRTVHAIESKRSRYRLTCRNEPV